MARRTAKSWVEPYAWSVFALGAGLTVLSLGELYQDGLSVELLGLMVLSVFASTLLIRVRSLNATVASSEIFVFASIVLFGAAAATVTAVVGGFAIVAKNESRRPSQMAFNVGESAVSAWTAAQLFYVLADRPPLVGQSVDVWTLAPALLLLATVYFGLNAVLMTTAVALDGHIRLPEFARNNLPHLTLNFGVSTFLMFLIVANADNLTFATIGIIGPMLLLSYYSSRATMSAVQKDNDHLVELNALYASTVETLAMAIDAKDEVTHGHIQRMQDAVVELAREVGVTDEKELKAVRAAALLHDLGKIAVPEHILNKPGRLTAAEFEQMKTHATIGANIVSKIGFPFPVEPIVRHHHESWDGRGYPAGLQGEQIPIGCRVLAVVDCFDALRSHRPYRRQLSEAESMEIVVSRSGTMYDPAVVDAFVRIQPRLALGDAESAEDAPSSEPIGETSVDERERPGPRGALTPLPAWVSTVAPEAVPVFYRHDQARNVLTPLLTSKDRLHAFSGLEIPVGKRISGWVAATRQTVANSDAQIDFEGRHAGLNTLQRCVSVAVQQGGELYGVLSLYTDDATGFTPEQVSLLERRAAELRSCVSIAATSDASGGAPASAPPAPSPVSSATPSRQLRLVRPVTDRQAS